MKRKKITSLVLHKHKISNLQNYSKLIGGTDTATNPVDANYESNMSECEMCPTLDYFTGCITNDTTRSLQTPTLVVGCNALGTNGCVAMSDEDC